MSVVKVSLLANTPDPVQVCAAAARLCYSNSEISDLMLLDTDSSKELLNKVISSGHLSVLEHASFTFGIEGISRTCSHQLVRHRIASYSQQSQRYVSAKEGFQAVTPPSVLEGGFLPEILDLYGDIEYLYKQMIDSGIPAEDARFILPNAATTKLVMTMNARELLHFFSLRTCNRAQWEIRDLAMQVLALLRKTAYNIFKHAGPGCYLSKCPEGGMCCGKMDEVRELVGSL